MKEESVLWNALLIFLIILNISMTVFVISNLSIIAIPIDIIISVTFGLMGLIGCVVGIASSLKGIKTLEKISADYYRYLNESLNKEVRIDRYWHRLRDGMRKSPPKYSLLQQFVINILE